MWGGVLLIMRIRGATMTDRDLQTVRDWCRANRVSVKQMWPGGPWGYREANPETTRNLPPMSRESEADLYVAIWEQVGPWLQSVRNMDAAEVEGPYQAAKYFGSDRWHVFGNDEDVGDLSEQSARTIAGILNRECQ